LQLEENPQKNGPVRIFVSIETHLALFAVKGTVPFLLTQKSGQSQKNTCKSGKNTKKQSKPRHQYRFTGFLAPAFRVETVN
jgi:hypothetical protein